MPLSKIEDIIEDLRQGKMVILMDDEDRENEGDLIMAASMVTAEDINFMARYGRGLICMTLTRERCEQLRLPLMVRKTNDRHGTNFTVSIEAARGVTTGISAADRAVTVQAAVAENASASDIVMPGHIFPLMAQPGGVLTRAGHTEAGCDLARLAGLEPASTIVEILNEDGSMARRPDLEVFAEQHKLKIGTIADLIHYRIENEKTVERVAECHMPTEAGDFRLVSFHDALEDSLHFALVYGEPDMSKPVLVRVHMQNTLCDLFASELDECSRPLHQAMQRIAEEGAGIVVVLRNADKPADIERHMRRYQQGNKGVNSQEQADSHDLRTYGLGAQILLDLGVQQMRVLGSKLKLHGLSGFGLSITDYVSFKKVDRSSGDKV
jgi:3,4-dihydroxy 2-butanone 4-phosphate synthase/GTP cyclohydrolase II